MAVEYGGVRERGEAEDVGLERARGSGDASGSEVG